jgi:3-phosphoshikimate 1-carboxyvinyltransferase
MNTTRTGFLNHLMKMGANIEIEFFCNEEYIEPTATLTVSYTQDLQNINIDSTDLPTLIDEIPILTLLASQAQGLFVLSNASELRVKETDRIHATVKNLQLLGIDISEQEDGLSISGKQEIIGGEVSCYHDHRIAMMCVIAGLISKEGVLVKDVACIETSFPNFYKELLRCGANISMT